MWVSCSVLSVTSDGFISVFSMVISRVIPLAVYRIPIGVYRISMGVYRIPICRSREGAGFYCSRIGAGTNPPRRSSGGRQCLRFCLFCVCRRRGTSAAFSGLGYPPPAAHDGQ